MFYGSNTIQNLLARFPKTPNSVQHTVKRWKYVIRKEIMSQADTLKMFARIIVSCAKMFVIGDRSGRDIEI